VTGNILGQLRPNPPAAQIVGDLRASQQHREPPAQAKQQVAQSQMAGAAALASALTQSAAPAVTTVGLVEPAVAPATTQTSTAPILPTQTTPPLTTLAGMAGVTNGSQTGGMFTAAPPFSGFVSWGPGAFDLDLHATGPAAGGAGRFHVFFANTGSLTAQPFTFLHQDCICSNGSEAITLQQLNQGGVYRFSVFNFGNQSTTATNLSNESGAVFKFVQGGTVVNLSQGSTVTGGTTLTTIAVPTGQAGNTWVVGEYDPATNTFRPTNTITNATSSSTVQLQTPKR